MTNDREQGGHLDHSAGEGGGGPERERSGSYKGTFGTALRSGEGCPNIGMELANHDVAELMGRQLNHR